jgi:hypothetical protein
MVYTLNVPRNVSKIPSTDDGAAGPHPVAVAQVAVQRPIAQRGHAGDVTLGLAWFMGSLEYSWFYSNYSAPSG